ncbi:protein of unknown function [Pseudomonas mediterranea]
MMRLLLVCLLVNLAWMKAEKSQKRAESSSFAKGRLEPKVAGMVTNQTQEYAMVTFRVKILRTCRNALKPALFSV